MKTIKVQYMSDLPDNFTGIVEYLSGDKGWYKEGKFHRLDGPACEYPNGDKQWWIDSREYSWFRLFVLINTAFFIEKEQGRYNLEWLRFLTEEGIEEFPIIPGMELDKNFKNSFEKLGIKP